MSCFLSSATVIRAMLSYVWLFVVMGLFFDMLIIIFRLASFAIEFRFGSLCDVFAIIREGDNNNCISSQRIAYFFL